MYVKSLTIDRAASYESQPNQLRGNLTLVSDSGEQSIKLNATMIIKLLTTIETDCCTTAKKMAKETPTAFTNTLNELQLVDHPLAQIEE